MKLRQSTVEPVLGTLIEYGGLRKIRTKGIEQANKCMILAATAYNLKKWMKFINRKAVSVTNVINDNIEILFRLLGFYIRPYQRLHNHDKIILEMI
jgi:hypothetical protein